jgi:hypothetical protein
MTSGVVQVEANALLTSSVTGASYTAATGAINLALIVTGTASSATTAGTECTNAGGSTYARAATTGKWATAASGAIATNAVISFTNMPAITVTGIELWDSAGTPVRRWWGTLGASKTLGLGDTLSFASGAISISMT